MWLTAESLLGDTKMKKELWCRAVISMVCNINEMQARTSHSQAGVSHYTAFWTQYNHDYVKKDVCGITDKHCQSLSTCQNIWDRLYKSRYETPNGSRYRFPLNHNACLAWYQWLLHLFLTLSLTEEPETSVYGYDFSIRKSSSVLWRIHQIYFRKYPNWLMSP